MADHIRESPLGYYIIESTSPQLFDLNGQLVVDRGLAPVSDMAQAVAIVAKGLRLGNVANITRTMVQCVENAAGCEKSATRNLAKIQDSN